MKRKKITLTVLQCQRESCGHEWIPRSTTPPRVCPKCKRDWQVPLKRGPYKTSEAPPNELEAKVQAFEQRRDRIKREIEQGGRKTDGRIV